MKIKKLETVPATSHLPPANLVSSPSQLLSPIHLRGVSLPAAENEEDMATVPVAMKENSTEGDKDVAKDEDWEMWKGNLEGPEEVAGTPLATR